MEAETSHLWQLDENNGQSSINETIQNAKNMAAIVLNYQEKGIQSTDIAETLNIPIEVVDLIIDIASLSHSYLEFCEANDEEPDYELFSKEAKIKFKGLTEETIDFIAGQ